MCTDQGIRYTVYKPPYRNAGFYYGNGFKKANCKSCCRIHGGTCMPPLIQDSQEEKWIGEMPQCVPDLPCYEIECNTVEAHHDSSHETDLPLTPVQIPPPKRYGHKGVVPTQKSRAEKRAASTSGTQSCDQAGCGLLHFRNWWERHKVDISVYGKLISGTPIFIKGNTLRVINAKHSYFIPLEKIDYIRTDDGLDACVHLSDD